MSMKTILVFTLIFVGFAAVIRAESSDDGGSAVRRRLPRCRFGFEHNLDGVCVDKVTKCERGYQLVDGTCTMNPLKPRKQRKTDGGDNEADPRSRNDLETPPDSLRDARPLFEVRSNVPNRTVITETTDPITQEEFGNVKIETDTICPIGQALEDGRCVSMYKCAVGQERRGNVCIQTETVCAKGFIREGSDCVAKPQCPKYHAWRDGRCVPDDPECDEGFEWNGFECIIVEKECPPGSIFKFGQCIRERKVCAENEIERDNICYPVAIRCTPGYEVVNGMCQKTIIKCEEGFEEQDGKCVRFVAGCKEGFTWNGETCIRIKVSERIDAPELNTTITTTTVASVTIPRAEPPPDSLRRRQRCPEGYKLYQGMCYKCKDDSVWCDNGCYQGSTCAAGQGQNININIHTEPGRSSGGGGHNIINNIEPAENHIFNINNITRPVTLNNVNENQIFIYGNERCSDGTRQTKVVINGQHMNGCKEEKKPEKRHPKPKPKQPEEDPEKCCEIFTPRQCRKRSNDTWGCYHRRYNKCGGLCAADQVYLRPKETTWYRGVLTIAPSNRTETVPCVGSHCETTTIDCSGCADFSSTCSAECTTYPCNSDNCVVVDKDEFCGENEGIDVCE